MDELPSHVANHFRNINTDVQHGRELKIPLFLEFLPLSGEQVLANVFGGFLSREASLNGFVQLVELIRVGGRSLEHLRRTWTKHFVAQQHAKRRSRKHRPHKNGETDSLVLVWFSLVLDEV